MTDVLNSEWLKLRSVRSTTYVLLALVLVFVAGALVSYLMTADWDAAPPDRQQRFDRADPAVIVVPFGQFTLGVLGALAVTSEYGSGMIRTALVSVPRRGTFLSAKVAVVGVASVAVAAVAVLASFAAGELITGDRPAPISAFDSFGDAVPTLSADAASMVVLGLVGLGLGFVLRSTAGALVSLCGLLFVLPMMTLLLPPPWNERVYSVMPSVLPRQLAGEAPDALLSPWGAGAVMVAYVVVALGAGAVALLRRDA